MAESDYMKAHRHYRDQLQYALERSNNPFLAPEVIVEETPNVIHAAWNLQLEYRLMCEMSKRERQSDA